MCSTQLNTEVFKPDLECQHVFNPTVNIQVFNFDVYVFWFEHMNTVHAFESCCIVVFKKKRSSWNTPYVQNWTLTPGYVFKTIEHHVTFMHSLVNTWASQPEHISNHWTHDAFNTYLNTWTAFESCCKKGVQNSVHSWTLEFRVWTLICMDIRKWPNKASFWITSLKFQV